MAAKRKKSAAAKPAAKKKAPAKAARKTVARKAKAPAAKVPAKRKPGRPPKSAIEKAETAIVEMAKGIVPKARKAIRSVTRKLSGKK